MAPLRAALGGPALPVAPPVALRVALRVAPLLALLVTLLLALLVTLLLAVGGAVALVEAPADAQPAPAGATVLVPGKVGLPPPPLDSDLPQGAPSGSTARSSAAADTGPWGGRTSIVVILAGVVASAAVMSARRVGQDRVRGPLTR